VQSCVTSLTEGKASDHSPRRAGSGADVGIPAEEVRGIVFFLEGQKPDVIFLPE
jgi:hypothetical protein